MCIRDSFIRVENGEVYIYGMHISPYEKGNIFNKDPLRIRKLLLHRYEINKIEAKLKEKGLTLVPLKVYFKDSLVKVEIGMARGKKLYDKRQDIAKDVLGEGCVKLGLIEKKEDVGIYYMHGVSHHLGIDVHDVTAAWNDKLRPGAIITDEPGLYIDEWEIGIRIEDDILITEDGCEVLSENLMRDPDQIEAFMQEKEA